MNELFPTAHPSILQFINAIEKFSRQKAEILNDIRKDKVKLPVHEDFEIPDTPSSCKQYDQKKYEH